MVDVKTMHTLAPVPKPTVAGASPEAFPTGVVSLRDTLASTADLREASGKLSAKRVTGLFGLSLTQFASLLGRNKQTVSKTPDAETLQAGLREFERIARLRGPLGGDAEFRQWLRTPSPLLENRTPLELVRAGQAPQVADFVEDMLTGSPT